MGPWWWTQFQGHSKLFRCFGLDQSSWPTTQPTDDWPFLLIISFPWLAPWSWQPKQAYNIWRNMVSVFCSVNRVDAFYKYFFATNSWGVRLYSLFQALIIYHLYTFKSLTWLKWNVFIHSKIKLFLWLITFTVK